MARDIEEFLRRAAERRKQQLQERQQPPAQRPSQRLQEVVSEVEVVKASPPPPRKKQISEPVRHNINTSDIAEHAELLGERIQNVDEQVADRLGEKFDREVAHLNDGKRVTDQLHSSSRREAGPSVSDELIQMLSSPQTLRQAILVSEILRRPDFDE